MRVKLTKALKIALAALLVFLVAAPLIVGVYDAAGNSVSADHSTTAVYGSIEIHSNGNFADQAISNDGEVRASSNGVLEEPSHEVEGTRSFGEPLYNELPRSGSTAGEEVHEKDYGGGAGGFVFDSDKEYTSAYSDWCSGRSDLDGLFEDGTAHLVYTFSDGSTVDFGNPYILDWSDVPQPDDYYEVISSFERSQESIFAPEKAYAGVVSFAVGKLKYLCAKALIPANKMMINLIMAGSACFGVSAAEVPGLIAKYEAATAPIVEVLSKDSPLYCEEGLALCGMDTVATAISRGASVAELPAIAQESAIAMETTGTTLSGTSANWLTAAYQYLATNQVTVQFFMDNSDFITTFLGWLGAEFEEFPDYNPNVEMDQFFLTYKGVTLPPVSISDQAIVLPHYDDPTTSYMMFDYQGYTLLRRLNTNFFYRPDGCLYVSSSTGRTSGFEYWLDGSKFVSVWDKSCPLSQPDWTMLYVDEISNVVVGSGSQFDIMYQAKPNGLLSLEAPVFHEGEWFPDPDGLSVSTSPADDYSPQIIGQDAKYDEAGNITDYGNVSVPNVFAPDYVAPGSYAEALDQMNATATVENPANVDSPSFGQGDTTIKDWVDSNQTPKPEPGDESSQDDFKVEDLEKVFPFCIPWDVYYLLSAVAAEPVAPLIDFPLNFSNFGLDDYHLTVDFGDYDDFAVVIRAVEALSFCVGLALVTRNLIRG